jgi:hypothetical protein
MPTADFSRHLFQPEKRYVGAFLQQGRVLTDEDLNAHRRLEAEDERLAFRDIVCAKGTPNEGFRIHGLTTPSVSGTEVIDFEIETGSYYLGGLRFAVLEGQPETYLRQSDWLQIDVDPATLPTPPSVADLTLDDGTFTERHDLVYLRAWEQNVTAVEDSELLERALGGPDTSVYRRRMRRFEIATDVPEDCADAFEALVDRITAPLSGDTSGAAHAFDMANCELRSKARLTVGFSGSGPSDDLCKPAVTGGYLGAENQAIRVQLTATNRFIWGYDNASPLYRVQVTREDGLNQVKFLNVPRDEFAQPKAGQAIEILPWGSILPNVEKVAELSGHLATVETSYDPETRTLQISQPIPSAWLDWLDAPEHADYLSDRDEPENQKYFYLRLWTGGSGDATEPDFAFTPGTAVELSGTGLEVTFSDFGLPRDFWVIAARPNTPDIVVPWTLLESAAPFGPRWFLGGLALIRWRVVNDEVVGELHDCRTRFRPLCELKGCCTLIVGDDHTSHGEFSTIQDAVDALPAQGGEICVLRGEYTGAVRIEDRSNILIRGCGPDTVVTAPGAEAVFEIVDSSRIGIRSLRVSAAGVIGVYARVENRAGSIEELSLNQLTIASTNRAAIAVESGRFVRIHDCSVTVGPLAEPLEAGIPIAPEPGVYVQGDFLRIECNRILVESADAVVRGFGGLHIGGDSQDVEIRRNHIQDGNNNGITLGSVKTVVIEGNPVRRYLDDIGFRITVDDEGCIQIDPVPPGGGGGDEPGVEVEAGPPLNDVRIIDNLIENMGMSGISVARFFEMDDSPDFITVAGLHIAENRIRGCMRLEVADLTAEIRDKVGFGGIALADADGFHMRANTIENNGVENVGPISGVFVLHGQGIIMDGNLIRDNGRVDSAENPLQPGRRGGIVLGLARAPVGAEIDVDLPEGSSRGARQSGVPAAHIHDNIVVSPAGRALEMIALGPVSVEGNEFTAKGGIFRNPFGLTTGAAGNASASFLATIPFSSISSSNPVIAFIDLLGGSAVAIFNLGVSNEVYFQLAGLSGLFLVDDLPAPAEEESEDDARLFVGGNILFNDNQVVFDAFAPGVSFTLSSVLLISLDDISLHGNQCDCDLSVDFAMVNALVVGWSIRISDNRFEEGLVNTLFSAVTLGLMNQTTDNQSTHCIHAIGPAALSTISNNRALIELFSENACGRFRAALGTAFEGNLAFE